MSTVWGVVTRVFNAVIGFISALGPRIRGFLLGWYAYFRPVIDSMTNFGTNIVRGLWNGILGAKDWIIGKLKWFATLIPAPIRRALDIRSPSRVFHQIGGYVMQGLDGGLSAGQSAPIDRIKGIAGDLTRAAALGVAAPALAASPGGSGSGTQSAPIGPVTIVIQQLPGQSSQDLARAVAAEMEKLRRREAAAGRSSYADEQDYGALA